VAACPRSGLFTTFPAHQPAVSLLAPPWADAAGDPAVRAVVVTTAGGWSRRLTTADAVARLFTDRFPEVWGPGNPPPPAVVDDLLAQPVSVGGVTGVASRYDLASGTAVLVGDCAASCWPSLGQGCNAALAGVAVLGGALFPAVPRGSPVAAASVAGQSPPPPPPPPPADAVAGRLAAFTAAFKPDADAAGVLSARGMGGNAGVMTRAAMARLAAVGVASKVLGTPPPALSEVGNADVPYATVLRRWRAEDAVVDGVVAAAAVGAAAVVVALLVPRLGLGG